MSKTQITVTTACAEMTEGISTRVIGRLDDLFFLIVLRLANLHDSFFYTVVARLAVAMLMTSGIYTILALIW